MANNESQTGRGGRRDLAKERRWRVLLRRQAASRVSVRAFCRRERLSEPSFHAWRRTIRQRDAEAKSPSGRGGRSLAGRTTVEDRPRRTSLRRGGRSLAGRTTVEDRPRRTSLRRGRRSRRPAFVPVLIEDDRGRNGRIAIELAGGRVLRLPESIATERLIELVVALEVADRPQHGRRSAAADESSAWQARAAS
jgi:hypothetical protein